MPGIDSLNSFDEFWKGRKTIKGVLILNALLPGLGLLYSGGWTIALAPFCLLLVVGSLSNHSFIGVWLTGWFWTSLLGCIIANRTRVNSECEAPGPNTRDLADSLGKGHGKGASIAALDTLEQKVKKADELLKATRALEIEKSTKKPKTEKYDLAEPTPLVEERPSSLAREVPHFKTEINKVTSNEQHESLILKTPEYSFESVTPSVEALPPLSHFELAQSEPVSTDDSPTSSAQVEQQVPEFKPEVVPPLDPSETPNSQSAPPAQTIDFNSSLVDLDSTLLKGSQLQSEVLDFNATDSPNMGAPQEISSDFSPPNDLSFSKPTVPTNSHKNDGGPPPPDAKFALEAAQTPEQIQQFFDKLGETVGTSYQQEPLSKPSFDISFPSFESPTFSFDFSSALSSDFSSMSGNKPESDEDAPPKDSCQRCGVAKHDDFTFCLGCGISF